MIDPFEFCKSPRKTGVSLKSDHLDQGGLEVVRPGSEHYLKKLNHNLSGVPKFLQEHQTAALGCLA
jgi:hypothetical protein